MHVTAIIVAWNSAPDLKACLASLGDVATVVIDNGSTDGSAATAQQFGAEVLRLERNHGFAAAANLGLRRVATDYVLFLNPDVVVGPGTIDRCLHELTTSPTIGLVGPDTRLPDGAAEPPAARRDRTALQIVVESLGLVHLSRRFDLQMIRDRVADSDVDAVNGAFMMMPTRLIRELGGLDETVFMYLEDQELCRRVRDAGYRVRFLAGARAVHGNGTSTRRGSPDEQARAYLHRIDADLEFLRRHGRSGEAGAAVAAFALRALIGMGVSLIRQQRRLRYRSALIYTLRQIRGRRPPPPV